MKSKNITWKRFILITLIPIVVGALTYFGMFQITTKLFPDIPEYDSLCSAICSFVILIMTYKLIESQ